MKHAVHRRDEACLALALALALGLLLAGCGAKGQPNPAAEAPPATVASGNRTPTWSRWTIRNSFHWATAERACGRARVERNWGCQRRTYREMCP